MTYRAIARAYPSLWRAYLAVALAPAALYYVLPASAHTAVFLGAGLAATAAILAGVAIHKPSQRLPWLVLAAGQFVIVAGDVGLAIAPPPAGIWQFVSPEDLAYFAGYALLAAGFGILVLRRTLMPDWHLLLDAGVLTAGLGLLAWVVLVDPLLADATATASERSRDIAYAITDTGLVFVFACLLFAPGGNRPAIRLFALSLVSLVAAGAVVAYFEPHYPVGGAGDVLYVASHALFGAAALHPSMAQSPAAARRNPRLSSRRIAALTAATLIAPAVLVVGGAGRAQIDYWIIGIGWLVTIGLVVACVSELVREQARTLEEEQSLERRLSETTETLSAIVDASPLPIMVFDDHGRLSFWNPGAERLYGYRAAEVIGGMPPIVPPEDRPDEEAVMARAIAGESIVTEELRRVAKDGTAVEVRGYVGPMRDAEGHITAVVALHEDLRPVKQLEAELFEARKMESVGRLAGGIAHDFNNILTAIVGFADLSLADPASPDVGENVAAIKESAERAARLTQQLLAFSRRQMLQPQLIDPNAIVAAMEPMLRGLLGEQVSLRVDTSPNVGCVRADPGQLEQVLLNLSINARDAMPDGGDLVISTGRRSIRAGGPRHGDLGDGDYVVICVADSGTGMDEETRAHVFEPFFTTRGFGRGLGLATTYGIVKQSGGHIFVDSAPGAGTTFVLLLPEIADVLPDAIVERAASRGARTGRILLVEDEPVLRDLACRVLRRAGYEVLPAEDPIQAIALADEHPRDSIDLLLTDVVMPGMRGPELARRLRSVRPGLRVLLTSGYAEEIVESEAIRAGFLAKPFTPDVLVLAVEEALRPAEVA